MIQTTIRLLQALFVIGSIAGCKEKTAASNPEPPRPSHGAKPVQIVQQKPVPKKVDPLKPKGLTLPAGSRHVGEVMDEVNEFVKNVARSGEPFDGQPILVTGKMGSIEGGNPYSMRLLLHDASANPSKIVSICCLLEPSKHPDNDPEIQRLKANSRAAAEEVNALSRSRGRPGLAEAKRRAEAANQVYFRALKEFEKSMYDRPDLANLKTGQIVTVRGVISRGLSQLYNMPVGELYKARIAN